MDDVEYSRGEVHLLGCPRKQVGGDRSQFRGLGDDGATGRQRRSDLPGEEIEGQVPRRDATGHADRFAH